MPLNNSITCPAFAAIDIGTSNIKCGVAVSGTKNNFQLIGKWRNRTISAAAGQALNSFSEIEGTVRECLSSIGNYCKANKIRTLYIGICGHVSSYLNWDRDLDAPVNDYFPIWSDQSCEPALPEMRDIFKDDRDEQYIGTFLPPATNWLATKVLYHHRRNTSENSIILQIADAIFHRLTGRYFTHFSAAVSLCHQVTQQYSKDLLDALNLSIGDLPEISNTRFFAIPDELKNRWKLPDQTFVFPGIADFHASFAALNLKAGEGFVLSNSSEIAGKLLCNGQVKSQNFLRTCLKQGEPILYGSTRTGGNLISWFFEKICREPLNHERLSNLSASASKVPPRSCPLFIPYLDGERAPFWNNSLRGGFINLSIHHGISELFRAVLTGVAFARRLSFESMPGAMPGYIKMGGGGAGNNVWNQIRTDVLGKPVLVFNEVELSIAGTIFLMSVALNDEDMMQYISGSRKTDRLNPDLKMNGIYLEQYNEFINYTKSF